MVLVVESLFGHYYREDVKTLPQTRFQLLLAKTHDFVNTKYSERFTVSGTWPKSCTYGALYTAFCITLNLKTGTSTVQYANAVTMRATALYRVKLRVEHSSQDHRPNNLDQCYVAQCNLAS
eukprot:6208455-Pleurochrysis_carterae.AAC.2